MSMAVVCAQVNFLGPSSVGAVEAKRRSKCNVASSPGGLVFRAHPNCGSHRKEYASLACRASSGGSRRDYEKILARKQKRRVRHMKGVTPSTPDLLKTLDAESRDQAKLDAFPDAVNDEQEYDYEGDEEEFEEDEAAVLNPNVARASYVGEEHGSKDNDELPDLTEDNGGAGADSAGVQDDSTDHGRVQESSK